LFNESPGGGLNAVASFYSDGTNPYIIIEGSSVHNVSATSNILESGLWLLPWDSQQLGSYSNLTSAFSNGSGSNRGLSNNQTIYGNAGNALFVASGAIGSGPGQLANPANLNDVLTYFNNNSPSHSYTGSRQYGGDLFLGLVYGFIGSKENLASTAGLPVSNVPTPPTGFGTSAKTAIGKLPSYWWYANGSVFTPKTGSFLGPLAKTQIGHDLWPSFGPVASDPNWNTYAVNLRKNNPDVYTNDSTNGGGMVGPYAWAMDDRMGGNLVYFNTTGNWLNIDLGAPYTGPDNPTPNPSEVFEQVGFIEASTGLWTPPASSSGKTYMTMFVSTTTAADTNIGDQQISLANSAGDVIDTSQFSSTGRISDSLYQGLGSNLSEATSNASFHAIVARTEGKSVGASNVRLIAVPQERFAVKVGAITSAESGSSVQDDNGAWVTSFTDKTSVAFSSGVFDLVNVTSPQSIQLLATSVGRNRNTVVAYRVDSITGSIQNSSGDFVAPGDPGYALLAINNSLLAGDPVVFNFGDTDELSFTESNAELFGIALITNGTIGEFLANNPSNSKGGGPNMFFSIGAANPDGRAHMVSLDAGVIGFEDLWGGGDADFNDVVIAFKNVPITV
jgi:hypothetical protein